MESPKKNNDCYFYYYSTCTKGDSCTFRHERSALGCETMCSFWKEGKCFNVHCSFRHMELRKNRKAIPCYWESQPGGCLKPHCPFLHKSGKDDDSENLEHSDLQPCEVSKTLGHASSQVTDCERKASQYSETNFGNTTVDPLVVNFEEESDNESAPTNSPAKSMQTRVVKVKTLEEIRLEKIQAESAAYYFYPGVEESISNESLEMENADDLRRRIMKRLNIQPDETHQNFQVLSLDEIRKRKKRTMDLDSNSGSDDDVKIKTNVKKQKLSIKRTHLKDLNDIKIKTLSEIRAEKLLKSSNDPHYYDMEIPTTCSEVSSTSNLEELEENVVSMDNVCKPAKRHRRKVSSSTDQLSNNTLKLQRTKMSQEIVESTIINPAHNPGVASTGMTSDNIKNNEKQSIANTDVSMEEEVRQLDDDDNAMPIEADFLDQNYDNKALRHDSVKLDDILLLDDDDMEESNINLKEEEDILNDIDNLLNN